MERHPRRSITGRARGAGVLAATAAVTWTLCLTSVAFSADRFHGDVAGVASGPGPSFVVGDGLYLRFKDSFRSETRYQVCYSKGDGRRCYKRTTGRKNRYSRVFFAPNGVGNYTATWTVNGKRVARWSWYNGVGD